MMLLRRNPDIRCLNFDSFLTVPVLTRGYQSKSAYHQTTPEISDKRIPLEPLGTLVCREHVFLVQSIRNCVEYFMVKPFQIFLKINM